MSTQDASPSIGGRDRMGLVRVARLDQIDDGGLLAVKVAGRPVCLARLGDTVHAFTDNCSHRDFPLSGGELDPEDCSITCDWHGARFNVVTGEVLCLPATRPIAVYRCSVEGNDIYVDVT